MKQELQKYAKGMNTSQSVLDWLDKRVEDKHKQDEVEHIIDYLVSDKAPKRLDRATYEQMKANADKWTKALAKKGDNIIEKEGDTEVVLDFKNGFKFVKLIGKNAYKREGFLMRHCVASYYGQNDNIYSLRDKKNMPHATISQSSQQIKGKGNGSIHPDYIEYVVKMLEFLKLEVRDSEMLNLGYVNIENIKDENAVFPKESLFKKKYFYKNDLEKITSKEGRRYENITLWSVFDLFEFTADLKVKFNFSISNCIDNFSRYIKKGKDVQAGDDYSQLVGGNRSQLAGDDYSQLVGGNRSQLAGGDYSQLAGGDYSQLAGGNCSKLAGDDSSQLVGGNSSQLAGGDCSQLAGGDCSQLAGDDYSQLVGGNYSQLAGGDSSQLAGGDYSQLAGGNRSQLAGGNRSQLAGDDSSQLVGGNSSQLAGGNRSQLAGGNCSKLAGGDSSQLDIGRGGIAVGDRGSIAKGKIGSCIVLCERDVDYNLIYVKAVIIDGVKVKEDTWYKLENKKLVETTNKLI